MKPPNDHLTPAEIVALEKLIKEKGELKVSYDAGGGGMGLHWCACIGGKWPFSGGGSLVWAIRQCMATHTVMEREKLEAMLASLDAPSS